MTSGLVDRHIGFLEALRAAGMPVSLAENLDAFAALSAVEWDRREIVRAAYAATLVKRQSQRPTFDALFDVYFPRLVGDGVAGADREPETDNAQALSGFRDALADGLVEGDRQTLLDLAAEMVARFGAMPGRGPGLSSWSAYTALQRVSPQELVDRIVQALLAAGRAEGEARREAGRRIGGFTGMVEADARRRIAEEKGPEHVASVAIRPSVDRIEFTSARKADLEQMRRSLYPLSRRLATRLAQERHSTRRGALDFRRTIRSAVSTGGVPLVTHHRPRRPHRTELVVLCDVSGSVASFAQFTLLLVYALREQFASVRAFTFIDHVHEVTHHFTPGADPADVLADLAASTAHAALWGRTNYGRALTKFEESYADALGPRSSLLILGDARSNYADLHVDVLTRLAGSARHAWWLNPEHRRHWDTGDSAATKYGAVVPMAECRNLTQLGEFVHDIL
ncbi:VWA domain-containing protein [Nocardioides hungaricus]